MSISPYAGKPAEPWMLVNVPRLVTAYYVNHPILTTDSPRLLYDVADSSVRTPRDNDQSAGGHIGQRRVLEEEVVLLYAVFQDPPYRRLSFEVVGPLDLPQEHQSLGQPHRLSAQLQVKETRKLVFRQ